MSDKPYTISGKVAQIGEVQVISEKYSKQVLVITLDGKYPKPIAVEFGNDAMGELAGVTAGEMVTASFYLNGYQGKKDPSYFGVSLRGVAVKSEGGEQAQEEEEDDLPDF